MRQSAPGRWAGLGLRVLTGALLAPAFLLVLYAGSPYSDILLVALGGIAAWEWVNLSRGRDRHWDLTVILAIASVSASLVAGAAGAFAVAGWLAAAGAMAVLLSAAREGNQADAAWASLSVIYVAPALLAFQWLRGQTAEGLWTVFWLVTVVWSTDVGAYFAGRTIGGPKLAPAISPNKTWAGLFGGMVAATLVGLAAAAILGLQPLRVALISMMLAIVAQLGDLFESRLKRRHGSKDSSALIPGHGGLLDRIDGLLAASLAYGGARLMAGASG